MPNFEAVDSNNVPKHPQQIHEEAVSQRQQVRIAESRRKETKETREKRIRSAKRTGKKVATTPFKVTAGVAQASTGSKLSSVIGLITLGLFTLIVSGKISGARDWISKMSGASTSTNTSTTPSTPTNTEVSTSTSSGSSSQSTNPQPVYPPTRL